MRVYQLKIDSAEEGEVIRWFSNKTAAEAAVEEHEPFGGCGKAWVFDYEIQLMDVPTTKMGLIDWLNANVRGKRNYE